MSTLTRRDLLGTVAGRAGKIVAPRFFGRQGPEADAPPIREDGLFLMLPFRPYGSDGHDGLDGPADAGFLPAAHVRPASEGSVATGPSVQRRRGGVRVKSQREQGPKPVGDFPIPESTRGGADSLDTLSSPGIILAVRLSLNFPPSVLPGLNQPMDTPCSRTCSDCPTRLVCRCLKVTEDAVVEAINLLGLRTVKEIRKATGAGDGCTCCHKLLIRLIERHTAPVEVRTPQLASRNLEMAGSIES